MTPKKRPGPLGPSPRAVEGEFGVGRGIGGLLVETGVEKAVEAAEPFASTYVYSRIGVKQLVEAMDRGLAWENIRVTAQKGVWAVRSLRNPVAKWGAKLGVFGGKVLSPVLWGKTLWDTGFTPGCGANCALPGM